MLATCVLQHPESLFDDAASMHTMQRELHRSLTSLFRWRCAPCTFQTPPLPYFKTNENFAVLSLSCRELGLLCGALYPPRQYDQNGLGQLARSLGGRGWGGSALTAGANSPLPQIGPSAEDPFTIIIHLLPYNIYGNIYGNRERDACTLFTPWLVSQIVSGEQAGCQPRTSSAGVIVTADRAKT